MTPFSNTESTFWPSSATTDTVKLGYTYPEFNGLDLGNPAAVKSAIGNAVNRLYGSSVFGFFNAASAAPVTAATAVGSAAALAANVPLEMASSIAAQPAAPPAPAPAAAPVPAPAHAAPTASAPAAPAGAAELHAHVSATPLAPGQHAPYDWTARIAFKKYEFGSSFSVLLFIGGVPENPEEWHVSPHFVGAHHAFVNSVAGHCANCRNQGDIVVEGFVHLTQYILRHAGLPSLEPGIVEPYLTNQLHWRVQKVRLYGGHLPSFIYFLSR